MSTRVVRLAIDIFTDQCLHYTSTHEDICDKKKPIDKEVQKPVRRIASNAPTSHTTGVDIFPRKVKSKMVKIKPALWEQTEEKPKNTVLKKEKRKTKIG